MPNAIAMEDGGADEEDVHFSLWQLIPDSMLLNIFFYLDCRALEKAGTVCQKWVRVSRDEILWRNLFCRDWKLDRTVNPPSSEGQPRSWRMEYIRLVHHSPTQESEILSEHTNQVLHVCFSHNGKYFATCSKDGYVKVWNSTYPASVHYDRDMKEFNWKYTQFSQFNEPDVLLLVSGVNRGGHSTSGEIAVFNLEDGFQLQCRVKNKPYDIFGTWYSNNHLLSGDLMWLGHMVSSSVLWLNKASQDTDSEHRPVVKNLYRFYNRNASSIRTIMVANCHSQVQLTTKEDDEGQPEGGDLHPGRRWQQDNGIFCPLCAGEGNGGQISNECAEFRDMIGGGQPLCDRPSQVMSGVSADNGDQVDADEEEGGDAGDSYLDHRDKYLIFTTGSKTYTPHQIGFKRIRPIKFKEQKQMSLQEKLIERQERNANAERAHPLFNKADHYIDLHGHIIGMALSPDHRFLYVNSRSWPEGYHIEQPLEPPPLAQEIDIHVIDMETLREVGTILQSHKAYTPNDECFFIFLDVSNEYVASGAEDKHGYLWDRHYGLCLAKFPHTDVVNSVAFNPNDPEMLVTASDDFTLKVWRSRNLQRILAQTPEKQDLEFD